MPALSQSSHREDKSPLAPEQILSFLSACVLRDVTAHGPFPQRDPEDVAHDAIVAWLEKGAPSLTTQDVGKLVNSCCSTARSKFAKRKKRKRCQEQQLDDHYQIRDASPEPWEMVDDRECRSVLAQVLRSERARLTDLQNRILDLKFTHDMSFREIGQELEMSHQGAHREYVGALNLLVSSFQGYSEHFETVFGYAGIGRPDVVLCPDGIAD